MKIQSVRAFAIVKNGQINPIDIYNHDGISTYNGEEVIPVLITPLKHIPKKILPAKKCKCGNKLTKWKLKYCSDECQRNYISNK